MLRFMDEAISLGRAGMNQRDGRPFGAVVVCNGQIVGRGRNPVATLFDPMAHAEVMRSTSRASR